MKKIIFASDGKKFSLGAFEFIKELQATESLLLTGVFLNALNFEAFLPAVFAMHTGPVAEFVDEIKKAHKDTTRHFEESCSRNGIEFRIHESSVDWNIDELVKETRFADLLVMSEELFCDDLNQQQPNMFMQQLIHHAECPVICVPEKFKPFNKIVFAYDGEKQSMYALKQFCNLFPGYSSKPVHIVYAKDTKNEIPDLPYLEEFAGRHFNDLVIEKLAFDPKKYFEAWSIDQGNFILISGSFSRPGLSTAIKKSFVNDIIRDHRVPVFIAHN